MGKKRQAVFSDDFKFEAVRLVETSGLTVRHIAVDLGVGYSTLTRWLQTHRDGSVTNECHENAEQELLRLRKENNVLRAERDFLKKATAFFAKETSR